MQREGQPKGMPVFFEGTEKKVELVINPSRPSLRSRGDDYWNRIVELSGARILSRIANDSSDAYLLSESSLFVFDHKLVMITCGKTCLPRAVLALVADLGLDAVEFCIYARKNELFPHEQPTSFFQDVEMLSDALPGRAFRFGDEDDHHLYLFCLDRPFSTEETDLTLEILMSGLDGQLLERLREGNSAAELRAATGLDRILHGFLIDDHLFEPSGYSLNALKGEQYLTVHVTPEAIGSYCSLETNLQATDDLEALTRRVLERFDPRSYDLIRWERSRRLEIDDRGYRLKTHVVQELSSGYRVSFRSYFRPQETIRGAVELPPADRSRMS